MTTPDHTSKKNYIELTWLTAAVAAHQVVIALSFRIWGEAVSLWVVFVMWAAVFLVVPFVRVKSILFVFLVSMPFQFYDLAFRNLSFVLSPSRILLPMLVAAWLWHRLRRPARVRIAPLNLSLLIPLFALIAVIGVSVIFSVERSVSVRALLVLPEQIAVLVVLVDLLREQENFDCAIIGAGVAAGVMGMVEVLGLLRGIGAPDMSILRLWSWLRKPPIGRGSNDVAHFIALLLPVLAYCVTASKSKARRWLLGAMMAFGVTAVLFTASRGGILALGFGLFVAYVRMVDKRVLLLVMLCALIIGLTPFAGVWSFRMESAAASFGSRLALWQVAYKAFLEYPAAGAGFGTYKYLNRHVSFEWPARFLWPTRYLKGDGLPINNASHNLFAELLAETGIGSFLAVLAFAVLLVWQLAKLGRRAASGGNMTEWRLVQHLSGLSAALLVSHMFTVGLGVYALWVALALLISAYPVLRERMSHREMAPVEGGG